MNAAELNFETDVACPVCKSRARRALKEHPDFNCTFVQCEQCEMLYYCPRLREDYVIETYLRGHNAKDEAINMIEKGVFFGEPLNGKPEEQIAAIYSYYRVMLQAQIKVFTEINRRAPDSVFEAGCSVGRFLDTARQELGPSARLAGCDANVFAASAGEKKFNFSIFGGKFSVFDPGPQKYDLVVALDYIEHTYTPVEDLAKLRDLGSPSAVLLLKTFLHEHDQAGAYVQPIFHVNHFTARTLTRALSNAGWRILKFDDETERCYSQVTILATIS